MQPLDIDHRSAIVDTVNKRGDEVKRKVTFQCGHCGNAKTVSLDDNEHFHFKDCIDCKRTKESVTAQFGAITIEELACVLYDALHGFTSSSEPWDYLKANKSDGVVWFFRHAAMAVEAMRKEAGVGDVYYGGKR